MRGAGEETRQLDDDVGLLESVLVLLEDGGLLEKGHHQHQEVSEGVVEHGEQAVQQLLLKHFPFHGHVLSEIQQDVEGHKEQLVLFLLGLSLSFRLLVPLFLDAFHCLLDVVASGASACVEVEEVWELERQ